MDPGRVVVGETEPWARFRRRVRNGGGTDVTHGREEGVSHLPGVAVPRGTCEKRE
jgi:hypothetical protein